jgi:hypothetical protein
MYKVTLVLFISSFFIFCSDSKFHKKVDETLPSPTQKATKSYKQVKEIELPKDYTRMHSDSNSFGWFLQQAPLKKTKEVYLYNGMLKTNQSAQFAVLDFSVGKKDLQQCADAVMRLRAEYFFSRNEYEKIVFFDNEKKKYAFSAPYTRDHFTTYLQTVFGMCGSASLEMQLKSRKDVTQIEIGDVFIKGGFPGHAEIVMDIAINENGEKVFLLAQSYMPAQDIHILKNPMNSEMSPWYAVNEIGHTLYTPEYTFTKEQLRTW